MTPPDTTAALLRLEEVSMAAWPGLHTVHDGPWAVRFGCGYTGRANSIVIFSLADDMEARLARCTAVLADHGLPPLVRLGSFVADGVSPVLDAAGYGPTHESVETLWMALPNAPAADPVVDIMPDVASDEWQDAKDRLSQEGLATGQARRRLIEAIAIPIAFGGLRGEDGRYAAVAYVAIHDGVASLNMVVTDEAQRGRRLAAKVCEALLAWAHGQGAREACLQMKVGNAAAGALYRRMGFSGPVYTYHYRMKEIAK